LRASPLLQKEILLDKRETEEGEFAAARELAPDLLTIRKRCPEKKR